VALRCNVARELREISEIALARAQLSERASGADALRLRDNGERLGTCVCDGGASAESAASQELINLAMRGARCDGIADAGTDERTRGASGAPAREETASLADAPFADGARWALGAGREMTETFGRGGESPPPA
jgi:hypothetical protein